jgi:hypothetical protein
MYTYYIRHSLSHVIKLPLGSSVMCQNRHRGPPAGQSQILTEISDKVISHTVIETITAREINGGPR